MKQVHFIKYIVRSALITVLAFIAFSYSEVYAGTAYVDWEGDVSSDWNDANNWEGNAFPDGNDVAVIDGDIYTNPPIVSANATWTTRYIQVLDAGVLVVNADLSIGRYGGCESGGSMTINTGGSFTTGVGGRDWDVIDAGSQLIIAGGTMTIDDELRIDGNGDGTGAAPSVTVTSGTLNVGDDIFFGGDTDEDPILTISGGDVNVTDDIAHLGADDCPISIDLSGTGHIDVGGSIIMDEATDQFNMTDGILDMVAIVSGILDNDGSFSMTGGSFTSSTVLDITGTGTFNFNNLSISGAESITQSVTSISVGGDFDNNGTFTPNTNSVTFNGTTDQDIDGSGTTFYDVSINKTSGAVNLVSDVTINAGGTVTFTQGLLNSDTTNTLTVSDGAFTNGGDADSYVDGYMIKVGDDDFTFPIGDGGNWMRLGISGATGAAVTDVFEAEYVRGTHPQAFWDSTTYGGDYDGMYNTSILDYWKLYRTNGTAQPFVTLYWQDNDSSQITDTADLVVAHYTGSSTWSDEGGIATGSPAQGSVRSAARLTSFSPFTFGSGSGSSNPLPITLIEFSAEISGDVVIVRWTTAQEINNKYFEIERSIDGKTFFPMAQIPGSGNSGQKIDYSVIDQNPIVNHYSYYRLSQTDFDGSKSYSNMDAVNFQKEVIEKPVIFPNPTNSGQIFVNLNTEENEVFKISFFDQMGKMVLETKTPPTSNGLISTLVPEKKGFYFMRIKGNSSILTERILVK